MSSLVSSLRVVCAPALNDSSIPAATPAAGTDALLVVYACARAVGFFKRLVLGSAGASLVFSALYPHDASRLAYETSQRVQKIEWYNEAERFCAWVCDWSLGSNYKPDLSPKKKPQDSDDSTA